MLIQETKQDQQEKKKIIDQQKQYLGSISESRGASGGIVTNWDSSKWICTSANTHQNWIRAILESRIGNKTVIIYNVYVPTHYREKEICWDNLKTSIDGEINTNIIVVGDFNLILHANEKRGGIFAPDPFRGHLETIIQDYELVDIIPKNRKYTWSNRYTNILNTSASDHYPITLTLETHYPLGPIPFKYNPLWNRIPAAREIVKETWSQHVEGSPCFIWETKLKRTKKALKDWAKESYQEPEETKKKVKNELEDVQARIEEHGLSQQNKEQENALYAQLTHINREEEIKWRIKSRQLWLQGGDKNTTYFHKHATARKLRNNVNTILDIEGNRHSTQEAIRNAATKHYRDLLTEVKGAEDYSDLLQHLPKGVTKEMNDNLSKQIEEEEIKGAIWSLHPDKAPEPDGFPICFYREFWTLIKKDLTKMIRWVQRKGKLGGYTNSTFLSLIPKENWPSSFSRFRPISFCNSSYKILTKILATRLKPLLPSLISENQGGFLPNRHITDSILLVQEAIHSSLSRKEKGFVLKLDLENVFNRVRHSFLIVVLNKMGFETPFINFIVSCISGPWIYPLINGRPGETFQSSRGLRQGCPLSPTSSSSWQNPSVNFWTTIEEWVL
eukprot:PITA_29738